MRSRRFFWKLFLGNAALLLVVVVSCLALILGALDRFYAQELSNMLKAHAELLGQEWESALAPDRAAELARLSRAIAQHGPEGMRITFVLADGTVLADSEADPGTMENHADRAEVRAALAEGVGHSVRWSHTVDRDMEYYAVRVGPPDRPRGVVRVSMALRSTVARVKSAHRLIWQSGAVVLAAAVALALGLARLWSSPLARITAAAHDLARGDLSARVPVHGRDDIARLGNALNQMRDSLTRQLDTIDRQRRTLEQLLANLQEGVIVAGPDRRIVLMNPAAVRLLDLAPAAAADGAAFRGLHIQQCIMNPALRRALSAVAGDSPQTPGPAGGDAGVADAARDGEGTTEHRLTLERQDGRVTLLARASDLLLFGFADAAAEPAHPGRMLVLTDITALQRAAQIKSDFVANASHELRTPVTTIRAAIETISTLDVGADPASTRRLLDVIDRQSGRLGELVADLLDLSRLESGNTPYPAARVALPDFMREIQEKFAARLQAKHLEWHIDLPEACAELEVNRQLLSLVLDNLVDNAIKFTNENGRIRISARPVAEGTLLTVEDNGCGIPPEDHARVFERFYQVERARTGAGRGTGLGLSIVRHATLVMGGTIRLDSAPGQGTRLHLTVPRLLSAAEPPA